MNQADFAETASARFHQIFAGDVTNFIREECVEIERVLDRHLDRVVIHPLDSTASLLCDTLVLNFLCEESMVLFNHATREMTAKIVYYGPGLCGKTTNLMVIFDKLDPKQKGKMLSLATKTDRTLFFDLLPVDIGKVGAFNLKMQLYTVPGQVFYNETRKLVLKGADAIVFVADSQPSMVDSTRESFENLLENMRENSIDIDDTPIVIQYNKRDIPGVLPIEKLQEALGLEGYPWAEAAAIKGEGVMETFKLVSKITAKHLYNRLKGKNEPIDRSKPQKSGVKPEAAPAAAPSSKKEKAAPAPPPAPLPEVNPFSDSVPFPESSPIDQGYEKMEEVSLEQLLEGRERPATIGGTIPIPIDDIEELDSSAMVEDSPAVAVMEEPKPARRGAAAASAGSDSRLSALEQQVSQLQQQMTTMRSEHQETLEDVLRTLDDLTARIRGQLS